MVQWKFGLQWLQNVLPKDGKYELFAKGTEKGKIFGNLMDEEVENFDNHDYPKNQYIDDPKQMKKVDLFELPIQTQTHTSLCRPQSNISQ